MGWWCCVVLGVGSGVGSGKGGAQMERRVWRRAGRPRGIFFVGGRLVGPGKGSGEWGVCGRGESWEWECVWRSHAGALGPERGVWPHRPRQRTRWVVVEWGGWRRGWRVGESREFFFAEQTQTEFGVGEGGPRKATSCVGQGRSGKDFVLCVVERGEEKEWREWEGCVADLRSEDFFGIGERVGVGKLCVWSGGVE